MKIALFTDTYSPQINGVVAYLNDAIGELSKKHAVVLFAPGEGPFRTEEKSKNFKIHWIPSSPFPFYEGYRVASMNLKRIDNLLASEMPDVLHAHAPINLGLQGLALAKRRKIPVVVTYHTHFPDYFPHLLNGKLPKSLGKVSDFTVKKMIKHTFKMADAVTAPTHELVNELRSYGLQNVHYLPNGINLDKLRPNAKEKKRFIAAHNIPSDKSVVIYLGRMSYEKRVDMLLIAFRLIESKDRLLLLAGGGPYLKSFKELARAMGIKNVIFTGFVRDLAAAYSCGDVFASASDSETFGLTFVEAMHMGLPVIGVRRLGAKEVITEGKSGLLVEPGNAYELARAMELLLDDKAKRKKMGKEATRRADEYSIEKSVSKTIRIYNSVIKR